MIITHVRVSGLANELKKSLDRYCDPFLLRAEMKHFLPGHLDVLAKGKKMNILH